LPHAVKEQRLDQSGVSFCLFFDFGFRWLSSGLERFWNPRISQCIARGSGLVVLNQLLWINLQVDRQLVGEFRGKFKPASFDHFNSDSSDTDSGG
jgi:hypothetical protein